MLHRSTMYVDAAYCYRTISVVCRLVYQSVHLSVCHSSESYIKTAEPIKMPLTEDSGGPDEPCIR